MLVMTVLVFLDTEGTLLAKFCLVIFSGFLVFLFLVSMWLVWERDEARRHQLQERPEVGVVVEIAKKTTILIYNVVSL